MTTPSRDREVKTTVDRTEIKSWVEQRDGAPARAVADEDPIDRLEIAFSSDEWSNETVPTLEEENLEEISWARFFETFEEENLAFRYRESTDRSDERPVYEFVDRTSADVDEEAVNEVLGEEVMSDAATSGAEVEPGMDVVEVSTGHVGTVSQVVGSEIHVNPDPGLTDKAKIGLGWGDTSREGEDVFSVSENEIEAVQGDEVRIYQPE